MTGYNIYVIYKAMEKERKITEYLLRPNAAIAALSGIIGLALLTPAIVSVFFDAWNASVRLSLILFASLFIAYSVFGVVRRLKFVQKLRERALKHKLSAAFVQNYDFRTVVYACFSALFDTAYGIFQIVSGKTAGIKWFTASGTYYIALALMRMGTVLFGARPLLKKTDTAAREEHFIKTYTAVGIALFILTGTLTTMFDVMLASRGALAAKFPLMIYGTYLYTFYKIAFAAVGFVKSHKNDNLITRALRSITTVAALASMLTFMTSLLTTFPEFGALAGVIGTLGNFVSLFVVTLSIFMITRSARLYHRLQLKKRDTADETITTSAQSLFDDKNA